MCLVQFWIMFFSLHIQHCFLVTRQVTIHVFMKWAFWKPSSTCYWALYSAAWKTTAVNSLLCQLQHTHTLFSVCVGMCVCEASACIDQWDLTHKLDVRQNFIVLRSESEVVWYQHGHRKVSSLSLTSINPLYFILHPVVFTLFLLWELTHVVSQGKD